MSLKSWGSVEDYDRDDLAASYEEDLAGDASFWKPAVGENEIRLLPPPGIKRPYVMRAQHWIRKGNQRSVFNCPKAEDEDAKCFLCGVVADLKATGSKEDKEQANDLRAKPQWLYIILDMEHPKKGPQVYGATKTACQDIAKILTDKKDYGPIVLSPSDGFNLVLTREGTGQNDTEYSVRARRNPEDVTDYLKNAEPPDIVGLSAPSTNEEMKAAFEGEDEGEEAPKSRRRDVSDDEPKRARDDDDDKPLRARDDDDDKPKARRDADDDKPKAKRSRDDDDKPARPGRRLRSED